MTTPDFTTLPSDELLERYAVAAVTQGEATESGNAEEGNRASDLLVAINQELRRRGPDAHRGLLVLLSHPQPAVRGWAGCHALEIAPREAERALEEVARIPKSLIGFTAEWTLREWRAGRLRIP
jgi:uncharacterized protein DUF2019